jgi:hypothetical protein
MKRLKTSLLTILTASVLPSIGLSQAEGPREVKLLTIGNSFADNSTRYLADFVKSAGKKVRIYQANLSAHSMEMHVKYLRADEANSSDPNGSRYMGIADVATGAKPKLSLRKALELEKWDYVTIQQMSSLSYQPHTYEPWASELIAAVYKYAPSAKVLGLETWAYREDSWFFEKLSTQERMHAAIKKAYEELSARHGIEILPIGDAFQAARATPEWKFQYPDPNFDKANAKPDQVPNQPGSLNVGWKWEKDPATGKDRMVNDAAHCNNAGQYLAAAVVYECLFSGVEKNTFCPPKLTPEQAASLRKIAKETVDASPIRKLTTAAR